MGVKDPLANGQPDLTFLRCCIMSIHYLVVSNPPHGSVDAAKAAAHFGLTPAEARMKANFAAPEIWFAGSDRAKMEEAESSMADCGMHTVLLDGRELSTVPDRAVVNSFAIEGSRMVINTDDGENILDCAAPVTGVYCKPAADVSSGRPQRGNLSSDFGRRSSSVMLDRISGTRSSTATGKEDEPSEKFLDLFTSLGGTERRLSFVAGETDFSSLNSPARDPLHALVAECERSLSALSLDRRLENVRVRARVTIRDGLAPPAEQRKLYSFGSLTLAKLLAEMSPALHDLSQNELGSRLSYLMTR